MVLLHPRTPAAPLEEEAENDRKALEVQGQSPRDDVDHQVPTSRDPQARKEYAMTSCRGLASVATVVLSCARNCLSPQRETEHPRKSTRVANSGKKEHAPVVTDAVLQPKDVDKPSTPAPKSEAAPAARDLQGPILPRLVREGAREQNLRETWQARSCRLRGSGIAWTSEQFGRFIGARLHGW